MFTRKPFFQVNLRDSFRLFTIWARYFDLSINSSRPDNGRVNKVRSIGCQNHNRFAKGLNAIHLRTKHGNHRVTDVRPTPSLSGSQNGFCLIYKYEGNLAFFFIVPSLLENFADFTFRFPQPHIENLRSFYMNEPALKFRAFMLRKFADHFGENRFSYESFAATRRTIKQKSFGHLRLHLAQNFFVHKWVFKNFADLFFHLFLPAYLRPFDLIIIVFDQSTGLSLRKFVQNNSLVIV